MAQSEDPFAAMMKSMQEAVEQMTEQAFGSLIFTNNSPEPTPFMLFCTKCDKDLLEGKGNFPMTFPEIMKTLPSHGCIDKS